MSAVISNQGRKQQAYQALKAQVCIPFMDAFNVSIVLKKDKDCGGVDKNIVTMMTKLYINKR